MKNKLKIKNSLQLHPLSIQPAASFNSHKAATFSSLVSSSSSSSSPNREHPHSFYSKIIICILPSIMSLLLLYA